MLGKVLLILLIGFPFMTVWSQDTIAPPYQPKDTIKELIPYPNGFIFGRFGSEAIFPGGQADMLRYFSDNLEFDCTIEQVENSRIYLQFFVEESGAITNIEVVRGIDPCVDLKCVELIKNMPNWIPATSEGKAIKTKVRLPIQICLD